MGDDMIDKYRIVPVVVLDSVEDTDRVLEGLLRGGLPIAEICFRTECAPQCIARAKALYPDMLIGAGTVIDEEQCLKAISCGAQFIVSPGVSLKVAQVCRERNMPYYPGVVTPTEVMQSLSLGLKTLKFFPADSSGGLKAIKALSAAFPQVRFMPTGGINMDNLCEYLSYPSVVACGGSFMTKGNIEEIATVTVRARRIIEEV